MPLIDVVGRKSFKIRVLIAFIYLFLSLGSILMAYPFILMISSSTTTAVDFNKFNLIPKYFYDDEMLFAKYVSEKYATPYTNIDFINGRYGKNYLKSEFIVPPDIKGLNVKAIENDWYDFENTLPLIYKVAGFRRSGEYTGIVERKYRAWVEKRYKDLELLNKKYTTEYENFVSVRGPTERIWDPGYLIDDNNLQKDFIEFKSGLKKDEVYYVSGDAAFQTLLRRKYEEIERLNDKYKTNFKDFSEIILHETLRESPVKEDWENFAREKFPLRYLILDKAAEPLYRQTLERKYRSNINKVNEIWKIAEEKKYRSFNSIKLPENFQEENRRPVMGDLQEFVSKSIPAQYITVRSAENEYRKFIKNKYKDIALLNSLYGKKYRDFSGIRAPYDIIDYLQFKERKGSIRWYFITNNYREVSDYIFLHGKAVLNTVIFCLAVILVTLTINPMCAYALSRFKLSYGNKVLVFLLATMAFPAEVGMIPGFLLLKQFSLLNTYWALILPGLANGYSIFILKGFFESLPKEFYEAAQMDGASEMRIFWKITLPLAKPVLAFLTIGAFNAAYTTFMFAMLVCQDPKKWTLMVWLYQMWEWAPSYVQMAAVVIAAIPTLLIFIFAQRVIMRGIIIPLEH